MSIEYSPVSLAYRFTSSRTGKRCIARRTQAPRPQSASHRRQSQKRSKIHRPPHDRGETRDIPQRAQTRTLNASTTQFHPARILPTFNMFADEFAQELNPQTVVQKILFPQITQLAWNLRRFPEAQAAMFQRERDKEPGSESMTASGITRQAVQRSALQRLHPSQPVRARRSQAMFLRLLETSFTKVAQTSREHQARFRRARSPARIRPGDLAGADGATGDGF